MSELTWQLATATLLGIAATIKSAELARNRDHIPLRALVPGLVVLAVESVVNIDRFGIFSTGSVEYTKGRYASWLFISCCFGICFLLDDDTVPPRVRKRKAWTELSICALGAVVSTVLPFLAPWAFPYPRDFAEYLTWPNILQDASWAPATLAFTTVGVIRAVRVRKRITNPWLLWSWGIAVAGAVLMTAGVTVNDMIIHVLHALLPPVDQPRHFEALRIPYTLGLLGGQVLLCAGLIFPAIADLVIFTMDRCDRRLRFVYMARMASLHRRLVAEFRQIIHDSPLTFDRMSIEITDGLSLLARYIDGTEYLRGGGGVHDPNLVAKLLREAFDARRGGRAPSLGDTPQIEPDFHGKWRKRAHWMAGVAKALNRVEMTPRLAASLGQ